MSLPLLRSGLRLPSLVARPVRRITSMPPEDPMGPVEHIIGLSTFFLAIMVPSGWILANLESYKNRGGEGGEE